MISKIHRQNSVPSSVRGRRRSQASDEVGSEALEKDQKSHRLWLRLSRSERQVLLRRAQAGARLRSRARRRPRELYERALEDELRARLRAVFSEISEIF